MMATAMAATTVGMVDLLCDLPIVMTNLRMTMTMTMESDVYANCDDAVYCHSYDEMVAGDCA